MTHNERIPAKWTQSWHGLNQQNTALDNRTFITVGYYNYHRELGYYNQYTVCREGALPLRPTVYRFHIAFERYFSAG